MDKTQEEGEAPHSRELGRILETYIGKPKEEWNFHDTGRVTKLCGVVHELFGGIVSANERGKD